MNKTEPVSLIVILEEGYNWHRHADQPRERVETIEKTISTTPTNDKHSQLDFLIELVPYPTNSSSEWPTDYCIGIPISSDNTSGNVETNIDLTDIDNLLTT